MSYEILPIKHFALGIYDGPHATPKESDDGPVFLGINNVSPEGHLDLTSVRHISEQEFAKWTKRVTPQADDIVFSYEATLHRYARIPSGFHGCLGRRMALIRPDTSKIDPRFLHHYLLSPIWRGVVEGKIISGATVDRIPLKTFPDFKVALPSLGVQQRVSSILSAYDDLIDNNRKRIALLEKSARRLYEEWFVRLQFPGHEHTPVVDGVPEGWERVLLPDAVDINPRTKVAADGEKWFAEMSCLSNSSMVISNPVLKSGNSGSKFMNHDTLLARITPCLENGKTGYVTFLKEDETGFGSTEYIVLRGKKVPPQFVYCLARTDHFRGTAITSMVGSSGRQRVQTAALDDYELLLPKKALLDVFEKTVTPAFEAVRVLSAQNQKLQQARDLLLPRLMSGELPV